MHSPEQSGPYRPSHATEIEGLRLTGANTVSGHGIAGGITGGVNCAGRIRCRHLLVEMMMGPQLIDPSTFPADPGPTSTPSTSAAVTSYGQSAHEAQSTPVP